MKNLFNLSEINKLIEQEYEKYEFKSLNYQREYILNAIKAYFLYSFFWIFLDLENLTKDRLSEQLSRINLFLESEVYQKYLKPLCSDSFSKQFLLEVVEWRNSKRVENSFFHYIINLDVWLGKTITSIISMNIIRILLENLYELELETYDEKFNKIKEYWFEDSIISKITSVYRGIPELNIWLVARKNLCLEFQEILVSDDNYQIYPWGRN